MTLQEVFDKMKSCGMTHASDEYSYHGRKIENWGKYIKDDIHNWIISETEMKTYQSDGFDNNGNYIGSNSYYFWK